MNTATNRDSRWLFPGRRAGQPMHPETLGGLMKALGVPNVPGRTLAMRQHVQQMPAPVVADAFGYHPVTTTKLAAEAASPGAATSPHPDSDRPRAGSQRQPTTVEWAISPVGDPVFRDRPGAARSRRRTRFQSVSVLALPTSAEWVPRRASGPRLRGVCVQDRGHRLACKAGEGPACLF